MELTTRSLAGLYFVVDPTEPSPKVKRVLEAALKGGVDLVQVWSARGNRESIVNLVKDLRNVTKRYRVPFIVNNDVPMAKLVKADGVHMDSFDLAPKEIRGRLGERCIVGYTTGNDLSRVEWAERSGADYVSFCAIYPTPSVVQCEIVPLEIVRRARHIVKLPIFASGGITRENAREVLEAGADGIAVISAIQKAPNPEAATREFKQVINSVRAARALGAKLA